MPYSKAKTRKKRISQNIATERRAGKPRKVAVAIAFSLERRKGKKAKKKRK